MDEGEKALYLFGHLEMVAIIRIAALATVTSIVFILLELAGNFSEKSTNV